jgi:hypothetical protein
MKINFTCRTLVTWLATMALLAVCLFQLPARVSPTTITAAQSCECLVFYLGGIPSIGFVPGETLRVTISDPNIDEPLELRTELATAQVKLVDQQGNQIAQSTEFTIPQNGFHSVDFSRESILREGDPDTGRIQVRPTVLLQRLANPQLPSKPVEPVRAAEANSIELLDSSGRSKIWIDLGFPVRVSPGSR